MGTTRRQVFEADGEALFVATVAGTIEKQDGHIIWLRDASGSHVREHLPYERKLIDGQKVALSWVGREGGKEMFASGLLDCIDGSVTEAVPREELLPKLELLGAKSFLERLGRFLGHVWTFGAKAAGGGGGSNAPAIVQLTALLCVIFLGPALMLAVPPALVYMVFDIAIFDSRYWYLVNLGFAPVLPTFAVLLAGYWVVIWLPIRAHLIRKRRAREAIAVIDAAVNRALAASAA